MRNSHPYVTTRVVSRSAAARHLAVSLHCIDDCMASIKSRTLPGDRYDLADVWLRMWGIDKVPSAFEDMMQSPLLSVNEVADN